MGEILLQVKNLKKYFHVAAGTLHAVDDVSFTLEAGRTLGIVGESGCGKTTMGRTILRLIEPTSGEMLFDGKDLRKLNQAEMRYMRREMQIIFQDPYSSLNPRKTIAETIEEPIFLANLIPDSDKRFMRVLDLPFGRQEITLNVRAAGDLYKKLIESTEGYAGDVPVIHQAVVVKAAIDALDAAFQEDREANF